MSPSAPRLSIVIPTRDTRELTLACLRSLAPQATPREAEVLVVDDASRDGTDEAIAREFPAVRRLRFPTPRRFTAAANRGLGEAAGEVLLLLNSDTEVTPGGLEALLAALAADLGLGVAGGRLFHPDGRPQWSGGGEPSAAWLFALASGAAAALGRLPGYRRLRQVSGEPGEVAWVTGAALALRRAVWEAAGPFDERFAFYAQDLDLCLRAREAGWRVAVVPGFRVLHHRGATIRPQGAGPGGAGPGRSGGGVDFQPELLWRDLVTWAGKRRGERAARRAARALDLGTRLRLAARAALGPLQPPSRRAAWRRDTEAFRRALAAVRRRPGVEPDGRTV
jgi:N-acetylglucosaminyl-diphospho-decaprenol L-rhamnosyltransferase